MANMVTLKRGKNYLLAELSGEVILENSTIAKNEIKSALLPEDRNVIVDLTRVTLLDSAGVGILISILKNLDGGRVLVVAEKGPVHRVLEITRMDQIVSIFPSVTEAIDSLDS
ncbi:MAG: STAS domain-containing protein [Firmicutes bacterium]|nr:STAS domain-containing protein [Bacillota bacterium]